MRTNDFREYVRWVLFWITYKITCTFNSCPRKTCSTGAKSCCSSLARAESLIFIDSSKCGGTRTFSVRPQRRGLVFRPPRETKQQSAKWLSYIPTRREFYLTRQTLDGCVSPAYLLFCDYAGRRGFKRVVVLRNDPVRLYADDDDDENSS